ncbi:RNA 2',3'-cyclic phosphodiesterase [Actinotalea sp. BY-33]|uniref:RNA 2',3'-cyclic phosphodiesterase n=1 Tax=Actinotalea soli TaxID=2819234 RepID=A0A939LUI3_9CELL|nr:RNA 2',3'-cyclic phosphodiesterase [Actinotalea soli]MBO1753230.1 RNA 2',3'-cyclic phosphodiesterase [Actinotalea soli]
MRLFLAVRPPQHVLDHLSLALEGVAASLPTAGGPRPVRWSAPENRHVTVAFYGELSDGAADELTVALEGAVDEVVPVELDLRGAGVFSHRTLWVGVGGDLDGMQALVAAARRSGEAAGAAPEVRVRSRPHLTVGRVSRSAGDRARSGRRGHPSRGVPDHGPGAVESLVAAMSLYRGPSWTVEQVELMSSQPGAGRHGGPLYTSLRTLTCGGGTVP